MHEEWEIISLPSEETLEKAWRNLKEKIRSEMRVFGRWRDRAIEREIKRNKFRITWGRIYTTSVKLDRWRCREVLSKVSRIWPLTDIGVKQVSRYKHVRTYVFLMLGTYVMILCIWLIFWQNPLYLYLGRLRMCLNTSRNHVSRSTVEAIKSVQEIKQRVQFH